MKVYTILLLTLLFSFAAMAQKTAAIADKQKILIGEPFHLKLQASFSNGEPVIFFAVDTISHFEILNRSTIDTSRFEGSVALIQDLTMTSWDSGKLQMAPFILGKNQTKPLIIDVAYSPSPFDTMQPYHDVHDILEVKRSSQPTWYWYLIGVLILVLLFILFFPKSKPRPKGEFVPDEGAYKKALKKINALEKRNESDNKIFYTELIQIFREYLNKRKNIYSFSKTTDDLSVQIEKLNMHQDGYQELVQTLRLSDMVKYAKYQPTFQENQIAFDSVKNSIIAIEQLPKPNLKPQTSN